MRVTKLIREYVEKTINTKLVYGEPTETYKKHKQCLTDLTAQLNEKVDTYAQELLAGVGNLPEGFKIERTCYRMFSSTSHRSPMWEAADDHERKIREKRKEAIENILLELELGATKADLERLIAETIGE